MEGLVNSVVLGGWLQEGQGLTWQQWEVPGKHVPLPRATASYLEKNKVSFAACCLCNTDTGFFNNKNIICLNILFISYLLILFAAKTSQR